MSEEQKPLDGFVPNLSRYREASMPHESQVAAEEAVKAFFAEVGELRIKYHIKDLLLVWGVVAAEADGNETSSMGVSGFGNQSLWEAMAAFAYGSQKAENAARIRQLLQGDVESGG